MSDNKPTLKLFIGQINLDRFPIRGDDWGGAAFWTGLDRIPLLLADSSFSEGDYTFLGALDERSSKYRDALFDALCENELFEGRAEFEDLLAQGALEWDGVMVIPKYLVEALALPDTPEFQDMITQAEKARVEQRQTYLDRLGSILQKYEITSLDLLDRVLQDVSPDLIRRRKPVELTVSKVQRIGEVLWISDNYTAEIVGEDDYPGKEDLPETDAIQKTLSMYGEGYEEAQLSPLLIRRSPYQKIAVLQSRSHTVYINDNFASMFHSGLRPCIRGPLEPVFIKLRGEIVKIIMPVRVRMEDGVNADSPEFQLLMDHLYPRCAAAIKQSDGQCLGYQRSEADDEPVDTCKRCPRHTMYDPDECGDGVSDVGMVPIDPVESKFISAGIEPDAAKQFARVVCEHKTQLSILGIGLEDFAAAIGPVLKSLADIWTTVCNMIEMIVEAITPMEIATWLDEIKESCDNTPSDTPLTRKWRTERRRAERERERVRYKYYEWRMMMATPWVQAYRGMFWRGARNEPHRN